MRRDEEILKAAEALFYEKSFAGVGVEEIGRRAGISGPGIYKHFASKDDILASLLERAAMDLLASFVEPRQNPWDELEMIIRRHVEYTLEHPKLTTIWVREVRSLAKGFRRRMERRDDAYTHRLLAVMRRCLPESDDDGLRCATWMMIYQLSSVGLWPASVRRTDNLADMMTEVAISGIRGLRTDADALLADPA